MRTRIEGFVLVDLLMTTVSITVLAAILFPVFGKAREKARTAVCQSNLQQIGMALQVYAKDNYGHFPPEGSYPVALTPYIQERDVFVCPSHPQRDIGSYVYRGGWSSDGPAVAIIAYDAKVKVSGKETGVHNEGTNTLWLDGHVTWLNLSDGRSGTDIFEFGLKGQTPAGEWTAKPPQGPPGGPVGVPGLSSGSKGGAPGGPPLAPPTAGPGGPPVGLPPGAPPGGGLGHRSKGSGG